jgi:hypothetical protein
MVHGDRVLRYLTNAMSAQPTPFARLAWLASLRDGYSGQYIHEGWIGASSIEEVNAAAEDMHLKLFEIVTTLPLAVLCFEMRDHFDSLAESELEAANYWIEYKTYLGMIPPDSPELGKKFFISQVCLALEVLVRAPHWDRLSMLASSLSKQPDPQHPLHSLN